MSDKVPKVKVGDKIVEGGHVQRVFKVETRDNGAGERVAHFKPYFKRDIDQTLTSSVPVANFDMANIRQPANREKIKEAKSVLSGKKPKSPAETKELEDKLKQNETKKTAEVLMSLWAEKKKRENGLPLTKKRLYDKAMRVLTEEFAYALNKNLDQAEATVQRALAS